MTLLWAPFSLRPHRREETGVRYADIYVRGVAAGIDLTILFILMFDLTMMIENSVYAAFDQVPLRLQPTATDSAVMSHMLWTARYPWLISSGLSVLMMGAVLVACQCIWNTTPGKWLMGLRVVDAKTLTPPSRLRYALRFLAYIPAILPLMLGMIWISFNKQRRGWHDYLVGTTVIHTRPRDWIWVKVKQLYRHLRGNARPSP